VAEIKLQKNVADKVQNERVSRDEVNNKKRKRGRGRMEASYLTMEGLHQLCQASRRRCSIERRDHT
jgi:hypothetical protein